MITNEHYYRALAIMDRIEEIREQKGIPKVAFAKKLGYTLSLYHVTYDNCRIVKISMLIKFAKVLDVSVEYLLTGKNLEPFKDFELNFDGITQAKTRGTSNSLRVIKHRLKSKKSNDIVLKTLFEFEYYLKTPAIKLIGG